MALTGGGDVVVRDERPGDVAAIRELNIEAFGGPLEARIVDRLRAGDGVLLSLVAVAAAAAAPAAAQGDEVLGHILFSPVRLESGEGVLDGAGLGPMAVRPAAQRRGLGSLLVAEGLRRVRERRCPFVVVLGHPHYYPRFGFEPASRHGVRCTWDVPDDVFMLLPLEPAVLRGRTGVARYREEFDEVE